MLDLSTTLSLLGIIVGVALGLGTFFVADRRASNSRWLAAKATILRELSPSLGEDNVPSRDVIQSTIHSVLREYRGADLDAVTVDEVVDDIVRRVTSDPFVPSERRRKLQHAILALKTSSLRISPSEVLSRNEVRGPTAPPIIAGILVGLIANAIYYVVSVGYPWTHRTMPWPRFQLSYIPIALAVGILTSFAIALVVISRRRSRDKIKFVLDMLVARIQRANAPPPGSPAPITRATLFKANRKRRCLDAVARSGQLYQSGISSFRIDDDNERYNEGVAGQAWFQDATITLTDLPRVPLTWSPDDPDCADYARRSLLSPAKAGRLRLKSRSLVATPIRDQQARRWGVLVVDSTAPNAFGETATVGILDVATLLGTLL